MDTESINSFINEVQRKIDGSILSDRYTKMLYSTDASIYQVTPLAVMIPKTVDDIQAAVETASRYQIPILPRGAGSSLAGQAVNHALIIDTTRYLDQLVQVNPDESWVRVQPGIVLDELNGHLSKYNLQFGPDPASSNRATIGGIVGNNSTGSHSIMYGMTADHVMEVSVILDDGSTATFGTATSNDIKTLSELQTRSGQIYKNFHNLVQNNIATIINNIPKHWRRCGGYNLDRFVKGPTFKYPQDESFNLAKIICGSEGTLAVITEIKLNLVTKPQKTALAILHFDDLFDALSSVPVILEANPSAVELLDNLGLTMCRNVPEYARLLSTFIEGNPNCLLITEFYGTSDSELHQKIENLKKILKQNHVNCSNVPAYSSALQANVWNVRKVGLGLLMSIKGDHKPIPFIEDAAVPVEHLADYVKKIEDFCKEIGTDIAYYAHASAGCVHIRPLINTKTATDIAKLPDITTFSAELLTQYGGAMSSEHGDGRARSWINERFFGKEMYSLFKEVKSIFDPKNILNPGNIVDAGPMTENLRFGADYQSLPLPTHLDFSVDLGFDRAVEMCNGAGICRKKTSGTMCPSFMVTRDEKHSTRGRANSLRAVLSGRLPPEELTGRNLFEIMDLCLECKACKAECPSSVDMAKIKFEYLAQYYDHNPIPIRTKIVANIGWLSSIASGPLAPIINAIGNISLMRKILGKSLGISPKRKLPVFARQSFAAWFNQNQSKPKIKPSPNHPKVVLFTDSFNNYNTPEPLIAATKIFNHLGYEVVLSNHGCCGRPFISKGLYKEAKKSAQTTVERLAPFALQGIPIIGLEPSCILSLRDEYLYLLPGNPHVTLVAENVFTFEEWISQQSIKENFNLHFKDEFKTILLHGHCHQKALVGTEPSKTALKLPKNYSVTEVDSGCCGMAGSFGYEEEHYNLSIEMGERRLFPAVRETEAGTLIAAAGFSCRQQIKHGTGKDALHPAEILWNALNIDD